VNTLKRAARKAAALIFPWPSKHEREAAIAAAAHSRRRAQAAARRAQAVERQIQRMAADNHFGELIARQLRGER
jgi:hypothetical protein